MNKVDMSRLKYKKIEKQLKHVFHTCQMYVEIPLAGFLA